jgi:hypothetical protein
MPGLDGLMDDFKSAIITGIAPYQPNVPPDYPNAAPTAGQIVSTIVGVGHPIQFHVLARLENQLGQVVVYDTGVGKPMPFINAVQPSFTSAIVSGAGSVNYQYSRSIQQLVVEVWASSREQRRGISDVIRQWVIGDYLRLYHADGTISLIRYTNSKDWDADQVDSIYVRRIYVSADFVEVQSSAIYEVEEAISTLTVEAVVHPSP